MPEPLVKICGLTDPAEARACAELGAWAIGVVFAAESPRRVDVAQAAAVVEALTDPVRRVGLFVDPDPDEVARVVAAVGLTDVQVHGRADVQAVRAAAGVPVFEGVRVDGPAAIVAARGSSADLVFLDASVAGRHGGTGTSFDWDILTETPIGRPFALAGGLNPDNVADAIRRTSPDVVDVSSGVERAPGRKDVGRVAAFIDAVRTVTEVR